MLRTTLFPVGLLVALAACGDDAPGGNGPAGDDTVDWSAGPNMPIPRLDAVAITLNGKVYLTGGYSGSTLSSVDVLDPVAGTWSGLPPMPTARRMHVAGVAGGKLYTVSGFSFTDPNGLTQITANDEYDPATNSWTVRAPVPLTTPFNSVLGNSFVGGGAVGDKLYVVEFNTQIPGFSATHEYTPATDTWASRAPVPFSYTRFSSAVLNGRLFVMAVGNGASTTGGLAAYNPTTDTWTLLAPRPGPGLGTLIASDTHLYLVGGEDDDFKPVSRVDRYDPVTDRWESISPLSGARMSATGVVLGGLLYVTGGNAGTLFQPVPMTSVQVAQLRE